MSWFHTSLFYRNFNFLKKLELSRIWLVFIWQMLVVFAVCEYLPIQRWILCFLTFIFLEFSWFFRCFEKWFCFCEICDFQKKNGFVFMRFAVFEGKIVLFLWNLRFSKDKLFCFCEIYGFLKKNDFVFAKFAIFEEKIGFVFMKFATFEVDIVLFSLNLRFSK